MLFLVSKFHLSVEYPCNIRFCCAIILTERIAKYQSECDAILKYQKTRCYFYPRRLFRVLSLPLVLDFYFGYSLYLLVLDLSLANQLQNYTRCSLKTLADTMSPVQCLRLSTNAIKKIITFQIISESLQIILDHLFQSFPKDYISQIPLLAIGYENTSFYQSHVIIFC